MTVEVSQKIAGDAVGNRAARYFSILSSMSRAASHLSKTLVTNCPRCECSEMFTPRRTRARSSGAAFLSYAPYHLWSSPKDEWSSILACTYTSSRSWLR